MDPILFSDACIEPLPGREAENARARLVAAARG
jgi:hypothetical protein